MATITVSASRNNGILGNEFPIEYLSLISDDLPADAIGERVVDAMQNLLRVGIKPNDIAFTITFNFYNADGTKS